MADREKVIKGLERCRLYNKVNCDKCPYDYNGRGTGKSECTAELADDVLALLKEQDAKNVVDMRLSKDWFRIASCPRCNELLNWVYHRKNCGYCGQAVKWEEC